MISIKNILIGIFCFIGSSASAQYTLQWIDLIGATQSNDILTKTTANGFGNVGGGRSSNVLPASTDGWIEFTITNQKVQIGFVINDIYTTTSFVHSIQVSNTNAITTQDGSTSTALGTVVSGDVFRISRAGSSINYYKNGALIRGPVATTSGQDLYVRAMIYGVNGVTPIVNSSFARKMHLRPIISGVEGPSSVGNIVANVAGGTPPYQYSWGTSILNSGIVGDKALTVTDANNNVQNFTLGLGFKNYWINQLLVNDNNGVLTRPSGTGFNNSGANGANILKANTDGWIEFIANNVNHYCVVGLASSSSGFSQNASYAYGLYLRNDGVLLYTEGTTNISLGTWSVGDVFRITRETAGTVIKYWKNGVMLRSVTSTIQNYDLMPKVAINTGSAPSVTTSFQNILLTPTVIGTNFPNGTGSIILNASGGKTPFTYAWPTTQETTSTVINKNRQVYTVSATDAAGRTLSRDYEIGYKTYWTSLTSVTESNQILTRPSGTGWNSGAVSINELPAGVNGWIEFVSTYGTFFEVGFTNNNNVTLNNTSFTSALRLDNTNLLYTYEGTTQSAQGTWSEGDVWRISRTGNTVKYYRNGIEFRSVNITPTLPWKVKVVINTGSNTLVNSSFWMPASEGIVPDIVEFNALKDVFNSTGGLTWINKTGWPTTWPASAASTQMDAYYGVVVTNNDITAIQLPGNNLNGTIPATINNLSSLTELTINGNTLNGALPNLNQAAPIAKIQLHNNQFNGSIPTQYATYSTLNILNLESNQLSGSIPDFSALSNLSYLSLANNNFAVGGVPTGLQNKTALTTLNLSGTNRTGSLPSTWNGLTGLTHLLLANNMLTGSVPSIFADLTNLQYLDLSNNQFSGSIPASILSTSNLKELRVNSNYLVSIPGQYALPDLKLHPNKANLDVFIANNRLDFGDLESYFTSPHGIKTLNYTPQRKNNVLQKYSVPSSGQLKLSSIGFGTIGVVTWQKKNNNAWIDVTSNTLDASHKTYVVASTAGLQGRYRYSITSPMVPNLILQSEGIDVSVLPPTDLTIKSDGSIPWAEMAAPAYALNTVNNGSSYDALASCSDTNPYLIALQLYFDPLNSNTTSNWTVDLKVSLTQGEGGPVLTSWPQQLSIASVDVNSNDQYFLATLFHQNTLTCTDGIRVKVDSVFTNGTVPTSNVFFKILRYRKPNAFNVSDNISGLNVAFNQNLITAGWTYTPDPNTEVNYDLEWVFIENNELTTMPADGVAAFLVKEPVRITTPNTVYSHITYYPSGKIWYRVRPVGYNPQYPTHRINGNWVYSSPVTITNHDATKTWQQQTVFAEEGKYKKIMSYYDGSLRARQTLTNLSSESTTLVAESAYDFEGRKAIDFLPAPALPAQQTSPLSFIPAFNDFETGKPFTSATRKKYHYDNGRLANSVAANTSGAAFYYSVNNSFGGIHSDYIPNAEGYVYSQTEYMNDGTGRVTKQSGVGKTFRHDSTAVTRMYYGTPAPAQLKRLFGTNVGKANHYKRNVTIDPNGQASVTYMDQEDRVIATGLAGASPANVDALDTNFGNLITDDFTERNTIENNTSSVTQRFIKESDVAAIYTFNYSLNAQSSELEVFGCATCTFDLQITLTGPDGELIDLRNVTGNQSDTTWFERHDIATGCNPSTPLALQVDFAVSLTASGEYTFTKTLIAHEKSFDQVRNEVILKPEVQTIINEVTSEITINVDEDNCDICVTEVNGEVIDDAIEEIAIADCDNILMRIKQRFYETGWDPEVEIPVGTLDDDNEYCSYLVCVQNKSSDDFDRTVSRVDNWTTALTKGYNNLVDLDPFFNNLVGYDQNLSGVAFKVSNMVPRLNNIQVVAALPAGNILAVTDPTNTDYFVDANGAPDVNGKHVLYASVKTDEVDATRWTMYRSFYNEAKRLTRLETTDYLACDSARTAYELVDALPTTYTGINTLTEVKIGGTKIETNPAVSAEELKSSIYSLEFGCGIDINDSDSTNIATYLTTYFNAHKDNLLRNIIITDVGIDPSLISIQAILSSYNCTLGTVARPNLSMCKRDTTVLLPNSAIAPQGAQIVQLSLSKTSIDAINKKHLTAKRFLTQEDINMIQQKDTMFNAKRRKIFKEMADKFQAKTNESSVSIQSQTLLVKPPPSQQEYDALLAFYNATNGPNWTNKQGWSTAIPGTPVDVSGWYGVQTDYNGHVINLNFQSSYGNNMVGAIPPDIGNLNHLEYFGSLRNPFGGSLPPQIFNCPLRNISIRESNISGVIPSSITSCATLSNIELEGLFAGGIPQLPNVASYVVLRGDFTGNFPTHIFNNNALSSLTITGGASGGLTNIPNTWNLLSNLNSLNLSRNNFSGPIPSTILSLSNLYNLELYGCHLQGTMPSFSNLSNLQYLRLFANELTGSIPSGISSTAVSIDLASNQLTGSIPQYFASLPNLLWLDLSQNDLTGEIPAISAPGLQGLILFNNNLTGSIPSSLGYITALRRINLNGNQLTGSIPGSLGLLSHNSLRMNLANNNLSGKVPQTFNTIMWVSSESSLASNSFTFSDLNEVVQINVNYFKNYSGTYSPQDSVDVAKIQYVEKGKPYTLKATVDRNLTPACEYQWFKYNPTTLVSTALNSKSTTSHTYTIPAFNTADGNYRYYYKIWNTAAPALNLISKRQKITAFDGLVINYCLEYDSTNTTSLIWSVPPDAIAAAVDSCKARAQVERQILTEMITNIVMDSVVNSYYDSARTACMTNATETVSYTYTNSEYHYTLYYYDQAGNLVQTVPPKGVDLVNQNHNLKTKYKFNSLNQSTWQNTPDAGTSQFWYNSKGQLRLSQNAQQYIDNKYSYTRYDAQSRIVEVGELYATTPQTLSTLLAGLEDSTFPLSGTYSLKDVTKTFYDFPNTDPSNTLAQTFLRGRVAYVQVLEKDAPDVITTNYSYDVHGNVKSILQQIPGLGNKRVDYLYDLVSGKVNYVIYQPGANDQFIHKYKYDADNRITDVKTSVDGYLWDQEANYRYYLHGPLARTLLGENEGVQGLDYYYTLQGWIKGVNMPFANDLTNDGNTGSTAPWAGRDVFAYTLGFFKNDYKPRNAAKVLADTRDKMWINHQATMDNTGYYNGNIAWMITDLKRVGQAQGNRAKGMQAMLYKYDQLHRIKQSRTLNSYAAATGFAAYSSTQGVYDENFTYDANGNILTLQRRDGSVGANLADDLHYEYYSQTNKLQYINPITETKTFHTGETVTADEKLYSQITIEGGAIMPNKHITLRATEQINILPTFEVTASSTTSLHAYIIGDEEGTFNYDAIGNLIADREQGVTIEWTPYGKVRQVTKGDGSTMTFRYDASGNRIEKKLTVNSAVTVTRYVRDASGNVMATYSIPPAGGAGGGTTPVEYPIYGSSRLGLYKDGRSVGVRRLGTKQYELSNHLGNVLSVITDNIRLQADSAWATVVNAGDYYAFGGDMPNRSYSEGAYRYGFNGKEKDTEATWGSATYDYGARIYNPRIGRWFSPDPQKAMAADWTPYRFGFNNPIRFVDPNGEWEEDGHYWTLYALGVLLGLDKVTAQHIAAEAEYYDHKVNASGDFSFHGFGFRIFGVDLGLGTWANPKYQTKYHGLTGGPRSEVESLALVEIFAGNLKGFHTYGDSFAHSRDSENNERMFGDMLIVGGVPVEYTTQHAIGAGREGSTADNIRDRPDVYRNYVAGLHSIFLSPQFIYNKSVKNQNPDFSIFEFIASAGTNKDQNIFLLKSVIDIQTGKTRFNFLRNDKNVELLKKYLDFSKIKYTATDTETIIKSPRGGVVSKIKRTVVEVTKK